MLHLIQRSTELFFSINQPIKQQIQTHREYGIVKNTALLYYHDTHSVGTTHTKKKSQDEFSQEWSEGDWRGGVKLNEE